MARKLEVVPLLVVVLKGESVGRGGGGHLMVEIC